MDSTFFSQPFIYTFSKSHAVYMNWQFLDNTCKKVWFSWKPSISLSFIFISSICTLCTYIKYTLLKFPFSLTSFQDSNLTWLNVTFPDFSLTLKKFFPWPFPLTCGNHEHHQTAFLRIFCTKTNNKKILNFWPKSFQLHWEKSSWVTIWNWYFYTPERLASHMSWLRWTDMCWVLCIKFSFFHNIWCLIVPFALIYLFHSHVLWYLFFMLVYCIYCMAVSSLLLSPSIDKPWTCNISSALPSSVM